LTEKRWTEKTRGKINAVIDTLIEITGDVGIQRIDKALAREDEARLQRYPRNRHKDPRYRDQALADIAAMAKIDALSLSTVNDHLARAGAVLAWACDQG
jgi:hypothetical protein